MKVVIVLNSIEIEAIRRALESTGIGIQLKFANAILDAQAKEKEREK